MCLLKHLLLRNHTNDIIFALENFHSAVYNYTYTKLIYKSTIYNSLLTIRFCIMHFGLIRDHVSISL